MIFWISLALTFLVAYMIGNGESKMQGLLNYFLLLLLVVDIYYISIYLVAKIPKVINHIVGYLQNMASSLDAVVLVALITGAISILNSIYSRYSDNKNKRREYLSAKREEPYGEFIQLIYKLNQSEQGNLTYPPEEMMKDVNNFNSKLTLWGSPKVVKKWNAFRRNSIDKNVKNDPSETLMLVEDVMNEMRKDLGVKSVAKGALLSFFINDIETILKKIK